MPAKFIVPGTVFLIAFQIVPILYTIQIAFSNYSTGHVISRSDAIKVIKVNSLQPPPNGRQYEMAPARDQDGHLVLLLHDDASGAVYVGSKRRPEAAAEVGRDRRRHGPAHCRGGLHADQGRRAVHAGRPTESAHGPTTGDAAIQAQGVSQAVELEPTLRYDPQRNVFVRIGDGQVFKDNRKGSFVSGKEELEPGWKAYIGFHNFGKLVNNSLYRTPFIKVFVWTFVYATLTVFISFAVGLFLAITLDKPGLRFQRWYRSAIIIPWAIPGFLSSA